MHGGGARPDGPVMPEQSQRRQRGHDAILRRFRRSPRMEDAGIWLAYEAGLAATPLSRTVGFWG